MPAADRSRNQAPQDPIRVIALEDARRRHDMLYNDIVTEGLQSCTSD